MSGVFNFKLLCIAIVLFTLVESKEHLHVRITRQKPTGKPTTAKPGAVSTTKKPGGSSSAKPGGTTVKPGASTTATPGVTTGKPGPGGKPTSAKPGGKTTKKPGKPGPAPPAPPTGGNGTGPIVPPGVIIPPVVDTHVYLGWGAGKHWWLSNDKENKEDAEQACKDISNNWFIQGLEPFKNWITYMAVAEDENERKQILRLIASTGETSAWLGSETESDADGKKFRLSQSPHGIFMMDEGGARRRRGLVSYSNDKQIRKRQTDGGEEPAKMASITVRDTHFPWLPTWNNEGGCRDLRGCEPIKCNVTTKPCIIVTSDCHISNHTECNQINSGNCTVVCEKCTITTQAECWMADNKCEIIKERTCQMTSPDCTVTTPECVITRPPCITKPAPCAIVNSTVTVNETECAITPPCGTASGVTCVTSPRPCTQEELDEGIEECSFRTCEPNPVCIKPEFCRKGGEGVISVSCPPPTTFCPPEIVNCPPPKVECSEPELECTDPEIYCPPPQVVCSQPQVSCSAPSVSCPTTIAECKNPDLTCGKPTVSCPPPELECNEPSPCLVKPPGEIPTCPVKCQGDCKCQIFQKSGDSWGQAAENCEASYRGLCTGHGRGA